MATASSKLSLLKFNGQNLFIDCGHHIDLNSTSFTIEFWAKRIGKQKFHVALQQGNTGHHQCLHIGFRQNNVFTLGFYFDDLDTSQTYTDSVWHHWSCVYDRDRQHQEIFCDGKSVASRTCKNLQTNANFYIGCHLGNQLFFNGFLAEIRIWNRIRTASEIKQNMNTQLSGQETNLVSYWPLDEGSGKTAHDKTGNGNKGTIHNANWQQVNVPFKPYIPSVKQEDSSMAKISSLMFNGINDYVSIPDNASLQVSTYTTEAWFKTAGAVKGWFGVAGKPGRSHNIWLTDKRVFHIFHTTKDTNRHVDPPHNLFQYGQWTHVAITNDGKTAKTYINGQLKVECPTGAALVVDKTPLYIGGDLDGEDSKNFFAGQIAEVRLWNYARSPQEITQNMTKCLAGNETGLVGYWPLEEGGGSIAYDKTGNGNNGTIHSGSWKTVEAPFQKYISPAKQEDSSMAQTRSALKFVNAKSPSDYFLVKPFSPSPTHALTVEFWLKVASNGRNAGVPFALSSPSRANELVVFNCKNIELYIHDSQHQAGSASFTKGQWQHCAVTWESATGQMHLYIDGQSVFDPVLAKGLVLDQTSAVILGQDPDSYGGSFDVNQAFQGEMTELRIWDHVRTPEEIQARMNKCCTGKEAGLAGYWPLDEGEGAIAKDKTSNGNNAELHGVTWVTTDELKLTKSRLNSKHIPVAQPRTNSVGLEDYAYWWKEVAKEQAGKKEQPKKFRRGRIWS
ncbi:putative outer membrane adhesin like protein [[Leptolyngbya] sp. PCC 7376]|uniref:LamG-like jellyroll fold domain-containing protein n=1 Tax=[Leptolyngbya] sp. PCC 7376 TaxID=111781 RepID=UPI00029F3D15|nr:LamG-like jellyroll fold domain-containing protein [[Leptolyngbya] sp. PCC 7376]AFY37274.1 putative outer membrane adhesin like protein [[Leptolyngbya] sp. PCC 7376]